MKLVLGKKKITVAAPIFFIAMFLLASFSRAQEEFPEGSLWRAQGDSRMYVISNDRKRHILNGTILNSYGWNISDIKETDPDVLFGIPDVRAVKTADSSSVYDIVSGKRVLLRSEEEFLAEGFTWDEVAIVNQVELESYPLEEAPPIPISPGPFVSASPHPSILPILPVESLLLKKITQALSLLRAASPVYPQELRRAVSTRSLSRGASGEDVLAVQEKLKELGFFPASVEANGSFGPTTEQSVKKFQRAMGITQNGIVGPATRGALEKKGLALAQGTVLRKSWKDTVPRDREVLLASWHEASDQTQLIRATLVSQRVKVGKAYRTVMKVVSREPGFTVHYKSGNGVNTHYAITKPEGWQVLANRFPIFDQAPGKIGTFPPEEVVYVPYNDDLKTPEIVEAGRTYLNETVDAALAALRQKGVQSVSGRGLVSDLTDPDELKNVAIIEHVDHAEFRRVEDKHGVVNKVFTILAVNREQAFRFSGSSKGALGLAQFIRNTYKLIRKQYPNAALIENFEAGMADHVNAFQAMALYHDVSGATLEGLVRERIASQSADLAWALAEVRAAAYNGGAGRVKKAVKALGPQWSQGKEEARSELKTGIASLQKQAKEVATAIQKAVGDVKKELSSQKKELDAQVKLKQKALASISSIVLRAETVGYLEKFRVVRQILRQ